ncbi:MAG: DUF308 domain-containing protein [Synergistaceae bacterium]|nr:DUF308 domain-containing protein [Synergistaceae bacterium]
MRSLRANFFITGAILIVLGILMLRYPIEAIMSAGIILGFGLIASGINHVSGWYFFRFRRFIAMGFIDIIAGIILVIQPGLSAFLLPFVIGLWFLTAGLSRTCAAFWLGGAEVSGWWLELLSGLAMIAFAVLMCASPLSSTFSVMLILSGVLIASGVLAVIEGFVMVE